MVDKEVLTEDEVFMNMAKEVSKNSLDPNTKVGACIVKNGNVLSLGFNDIPKGYPSKKFPWARIGKPLETKYLFVCHAELNSITSYRGLKEDLEGATIYVTLFPCNECAKLIIQTGIKEVVYECDKYANTDSVIASKMMFDECGVIYRQIGITKDMETENKEKTKILI